ncbi:MAG TPA: hypothetical protein VFE23_01120 [Usitatibacter sp.]|jgi:Ser/Thr protein kinase RdoA (MazF antagonist)|nr:hypothetical protein [Usitatibacter sp.]
MRDAKIWRDELFSEIRTISNRFELNRLWSGVDKKWVSSFAEEVEHVFSDFDIDAFLAADQSVTQLTPDQLAALRAFRDALASYVSKLSRPTSRISYQDVLLDPAWEPVMRAAANFAQMVD